MNKATGFACGGALALSLAAVPAMRGIFSQKEGTISHGSDSSSDSAPYSLLNSESLPSSARLPALPELNVSGSIVLGAGPDDASSQPHRDLHSEGYIRILASAPQPEVIIGVLTQIDDPELFLLLLNATGSSLDFSGVSDEQKLSFYRHALRIDPFQQYVRQMARPVLPHELDSLVRRNGEMLFTGELSGAPLSIELGNVVSPSTVVMVAEGVRLLAEFDRRDDKGGIIFIGEVQDGLFEIELHATHGEALLLDVSWPGFPPHRLRVWEGAEVKEEPPESIMPLVESILYKPAP